MSTAFSLTDAQDQRGQAILGLAYLRISRDRENNQLAIGRQRVDLEELAAYHGVTIVEWFTDNDVSGDGSKERSGYMDMVYALRARRGTMVLATEVARYQRGHREYMEFYETCERGGIKVAWKGGLADFAATETLLQLEMWALMAREELRTIKRRVTRKHRELEQRGMPNGGRRPFGFEDDLRTLRAPYTYCRLTDRQEIVVDEPEIIRKLAQRLLDGEALHALARDLNERGVLPVHASLWKASQVRQILRQARISGRREAFGRTVEGRKISKGRIVGNAKWPAIITAAQSDAVRRLLADPTRNKLGTKHLSKHVLSGLLRCSECGSAMHSRGHETMRCCGCGKVSIQVRPIEKMVIEDVVTLVDSGALTAALRQDDDAEAARQLAEVTDKQTRLTRAWTAGRMSSEDWEEANDALARQRQVLTERLEQAARNLGLAALPSPLRGAWDTLSLAQQRTVVRLLVERIEVVPSTTRGQRDLSRCTVIPKRA